MSTPLRKLAFCFLALAGVTILAAPPAQAGLSYSVTGAGPTRAAACANATAVILDNCDAHGPITTAPGPCVPIFSPNGDDLGDLCACTATTTFCAKLVPFPGPFPH
jgi:hypothetical protein